MQFRAKVLSKEDLHRRNAEFAEEAHTIKQEEAGDEDKDEHQEELPVVSVRKWKAVALELEEEEEADEMVAKQAKTSGSDLLDVKGLVSTQIRIRSFGFC